MSDTSGQEPVLTTADDTWTAGYNEGYRDAMLIQMHADNTHSVKWCSAPNHDPEHPLQCMGPAGHFGRHFAIDTPRSDNPCYPLAWVNGWWWERT